MTIISSDRETAFTFDHPHQQLIIKAGVVVTSEGVYTVSDSASGFGAALDYCVVMNSGEVTSAFTAVSMYGFQAQVINYATGSIVGTTGVDLAQDAAYLDNMGYIHGVTNAVFVDGTGAIISNAGTITSGSYALHIAQNVSFVLENSGLIEGGTLALAMNGPGASYAKIYNTGRMVGDVLLWDASFCLLRNSGAIQGVVSFGGSDDRFDGRGGESGQVSGNAGADTLWGGAQDDTLYGGVGADRLKGGAGGDTFVYSSVTESRGSQVDLIKGWDALDALDLSQIDAQPGKAGIQHLTFGGQIGAADPIGNDKVEYYKQGGDTYVVADTNGDGLADMTIKIAGVVTLDAGDFVLG